MAGRRTTTWGRAAFRKLEASSPKLQASEKQQSPNTKAPRLTVAAPGAGAWGLELFWSLKLGAWGLPAGICVAPGWKGYLLLPLARTPSGLSHGA